MMKAAAGYLPADVEAPSDQSHKQGQSAAAASRSKEEEVSGVGREELDLQSMVYGVKSFVDKISSHEGAEFPWSDDYS